MKKTTAELALDLLKAMQADAVNYLVPDNECGVDWFVNRMLWHLDGPQQRATQTAIEADIAQAAEPIAWSVTVGQEYKNCIEITHCKEDAIAQYKESTAGGFESLYTLHELYAAPKEPAVPVNAELLEIVEQLSLATDECDDAPQGTHYIDKDGHIRCKGSFLALIEQARAVIAKAEGAA